MVQYLSLVNSTFALLNIALAVISTIPSLSHFPSSGKRYRVSTIYAYMQLRFYQTHDKKMHLQLVTHTACLCWPCPDCQATSALTPQYILLDCSCLLMLSTSAGGGRR